MNAKSWPGFSTHLKFDVKSKFALTLVGWLSIFPFSVMPVKLEKNKTDLLASELEDCYHFSLPLCNHERREYM